MKKLLFILPLIILISCSVQKRKYQKGFYVSSNTSKTHSKKDNSKSLKNDFNSEKLVQKTYSLPIEERIELEASVSKNFSEINSLKKTSFFFRATDSCDIITLRNGDEVSAKVLEITSIEIKYKRCNLSDGPLYIVKKSDVFMIKYTNGTKDVFKSEPITTNQEQNNYPQAKKNTGPKKMHSLAIIAFVLSILGIFPFFGLGSLLAIIFAGMALRGIKENPDVYEGEQLARAARTIGIVVLSIIGFLLLFTLLIVLMGI
ncbi:MAG: DUF4190 domain-containing protein [Bacteroidota bacterium]|nr:DUF4190 domain-containing protein [Bacteroidota bacterium]MDP3145932.1 DUF4190 domain-containing protein [Bacteroidota bacterium]MDP3558567.1 DUF4190 domain-containing protein [Bacteroidota bacterium]